MKEAFLFSSRQSPIDYLVEKGKARIWPGGGGRQEKGNSLKKPPIPQLMLHLKAPWLKVSEAYLRDSSQRGLSEGSAPSG